MKAPNAGVAMAMSLADELSRGGVTDVCIAPGSRSGPLVHGFALDGKLKLHAGVDERSVSFFALGMAKSQGRPVGIVTTSGTAVANLHPAVLEADAACVPLLVMTADRPPELRDTGAGQTIDQIKIFGAAVRWFHEVGVPEALPQMPAYWRSTARRALHVSMSEPRGPVHLNFALRDPLGTEIEGEGFPFEI